MKKLLFTKGKLADAMPLVMAHHYSRRRTADPMHVFLLKDDERTVATAVFTSPANRFFGKGAVELSRLVRTPDMDQPLTKFLGTCLRWLRKNTDLLFCLSYADTTAGHHGGIYQAANFTFVATTKGGTMFAKPDGTLVSGRAVDQRSPENKVGLVRVKPGVKFLYMYPLALSHGAMLSRFGYAPLPFPKPLA